jgi:DNA repair protein RecN (Recombination protein N)
LLTYLKIENLATIRELVLEPGPGFNVLTGETGAGKSVIVESLDLSLGSRARRELVRTGAEGGRVTAAFDLSLNPAARDALEALGLRSDEPLLVVKREISATGRHRVLLNGEPATLAMLESVGAEIGEVHGQHENQALLRSATHASFIDASGGLEGRAARVREAHASLSELEDELERLDELERERSQRVDLLSFQVREIEEAELAPAPAAGEEDEDQRTAREHERLARAEELGSAIGESRALLSDDDGSALDRVARARRVLEPVATLLPELPALLGELDDARIRIEESARSLASADVEGATSPGRLAALDERLRVLERMKRKYGPSLAQVRAHLAAASAELEELSGLEERREELVAVRDERAAALAKDAGELSRRRRRAGRLLAERVAEELAELDMPGSRLAVEQVQVEDERSPVVVDGRPVRCGPCGIDQIQLLFSANAGEEARPLARIASGGEISRVMLVLKGLVAGSSGGRTWVFDEVDAGVGGQAATRVGDRLASLAGGGAQVFCVTHLPQVAARAGIHHQVQKRTRGKRTETQGRSLAAEDRVIELARMLSGRSSAAARQHAQELLQAAAEGVS